jgi:hypothetical protein
VKDGVRGWWQRQTADDATRRRTLRRLWVGGVLAVLLLGGAGWWAFGPRFQPDYETAAMDDLMDYTLLSKEFNDLPIEERMKLLGQLVSRMKGMSADDSILLAAFASGIGGKVRKQLEENASRIAIDMWDKYASQYDSVKPEDREKFLEDTFVEFTRTIEALSGEEISATPEERIAGMKRQAQRDMDWLKKNPERAPSGQLMGTAFAVMNNNVGGHAKPEQKARGQQMMRDMMRHFRGQDISTGQFKAPGAGASPSGTQPPSSPPRK